MFSIFNPICKLCRDEIDTGMTAGKYLLNYKHTFNEISYFSWNSQNSFARMDVNEFPSAIEGIIK